MVVFVDDVFKLTVGIVTCHILYVHGQFTTS